MIFLRPAIRVLLTWRRDPQANLKLLLERALQHGQLRDVDEISRTVYGTARKLLALDEALTGLAGRPLTALDDETAVHLEAGLFLLLFSESYPDYAVVNETVHLAPRRSRTLVNAVLRSAARDRAGLTRGLVRHPDLSVRHALSPLLVKNLEPLAENLDADLAYLDSEPRFHLRPRPGLDSLDLSKRLREAGVEHRLLPLPGCLETLQAGRVRALIDAGLPAYFQNSGSQLVSFLAAQFAGPGVWDLAAAPGSKSLTLAALKPGLPLLASDRRPSRLPLLRATLSGLPAGNRRIFAADAAAPPVRSSFSGLILADLPCTSSGTLRKNPDLKSRITPERVAASRSLQQSILEALLARYPGCDILYSVCSFLAAETEELLDDLLKRFSRRAEPLAPGCRRYGFAHRAAAHGCYLLPGEMNNDLFYVSLLRRME